MTKDLTPKQQWARLSGTQKTGIVALAAVELVLTTVALRDIARRPATQVRGPKLLWVLGFAVQPVGPVAYLALGRRD